MRRLARILLNAAAAASLLLFAATIALWVRSHQRIDRLTYRTEPTAPPRCRQYEVVAGSAGGRLGLLFTTVEYGVLGRYGAMVDDEQRALARFHRVTDEWAPHIVEGLAPVGAPEPRAVLGFTADTQEREKWVGNNIAWHDRRLIVPYWFLLLLTSILPAAVFRRRWSRHRRARRGRCPSCNYDLRATPTRCPECGTIPAP